MGIAIVPIQVSHIKTTHFHGSIAPSLRPTRQSKPLYLRCSASVVEEEESLSQAIDDSLKPSLSGCKGCGREEVESGCNAEGRIQGGIATVPGFGWWPIKAYRPCPGFLAAGGRYRRQGQSMDEVAFGKAEVDSSTDSTSKVKSSKKKK